MMFSLSWDFYLQRLSLSLNLSDYQSLATKYIYCPIQKIFIEQFSNTESVLPRRTCYYRNLQIPVFTVIKDVSIHNI